jgi:hypothetical protein
MDLSQNLTRHGQHRGVTEVKKHDRNEENTEISFLQKFKDGWCFVALIGLRLRI